MGILVSISMCQNNSTPIPGVDVSSIILQQSSIGLNGGFAHGPIHIRTNDSLVYWRIYLSLGYDMLSYPLGLTRCPK